MGIYQGTSGIGSLTHVIPGITGNAITVKGGGIDYRVISLYSTDGNFLAAQSFLTNNNSFTFGRFGGQNVVNATSLWIFL